MLCIILPLSQSAQIGELLAGGEDPFEVAEGVLGAVFGEGVGVAPGVGAVRSLILLGAHFRLPGCRINAI